MVAAEWRWHGAWHSFQFLAWDLSIHPRTKDLIFQPIYLHWRHVHVVQIWYMHISALKTHLMHKNVQTNPRKNPKITQHSCCSTLTREIFSKQLEAKDNVSTPKLGHSLPKPSCLLWEALVCEKHIPKPSPNGTKALHGILMPLHDSMPSFMNFERVLDLPEFKNQVS